ncbi:DNA-binding response regulator [Candidatus Epulonipiscium fishelsonii]|uniref:DNA-binding response regulator n=1 Tax=Candidatus Epulonipiscium fishelsonii TaxID=77094 RepID=A0ACC8X9Q3_9FIRM|nr:DNA-binding response regulator [Epulopiscium sp. SCG-B11WGA-EpuloA1]ONI40916.1 DNA-binding response regulator [Epulopiscium sp. SCG-B05WGA-EpuloA1]
MDKIRVLVIDDEENIVELIKYNLEINNFEVRIAYNGKDGLILIQQEKIDLLLLDVMLPDIDGVSMLKNLRKAEKTKDLPVIMISAKGEEIDKIIALELGADDYITKPFSVRELVARINALIRRNKKSEVGESQEYKFRNLRLDPSTHKVYCNNVEIELTNKEFKLLKLFISNQEKVFSRETLLNKIWGYDYLGETRTVDVHIRYLRAKLDVYNLGDLIETVRGVGYRFAKEES